jgi:hypothetical protein
VLPEEQGRRPGRRHDGAATVVAARPPSRSCTGEEAASCSQLSGKHSRAATSGLQQPSNRHDDKEDTASTRARAGAPAKLTRVDQAAWARSTGVELSGDGGDLMRR